MKKDEYYISTDRRKIDLNFVHNYLSSKSYWARGRSKELVKKSMDNSLCFGVYHEDRQIGFGRVATDFVVFAWLMDLFIDPEYRGNGLGKLLIEEILDHPDLQSVNAIGLRTEDAQDLYSKYGFGSIPKPNTWMFRNRNV